MHLPVTSTNTSTMFHQHQPLASVTNMQPLIGLTTQQLEALAVEFGQPAYRGKQLAAWIYRRGAPTFEAMTDLPREFRARLIESSLIGLPDTVHADRSADETVKYLFSLADGQTIESVY